MEGASLSSQAKPPLFSCWLLFTNPLPPLPCKLKSCGVSGVPAAIRAERAQAGASRVVWLCRRLAHSPCPPGSPTAPDTWESPHLHAQVVGVELSGEQGCWMGTRRQGEGVLDSSYCRAPPRAAELALALILHQGAVSSATSLSCPPLPPTGLP